MIPRFFRSMNHDIGRSNRFWEVNRWTPPILGRIVCRGCGQPDPSSVPAGDSGVFDGDLSADLLHLDQMGGHGGLGSPGILGGNGRQDGQMAVQ